MHRIPSLVLLSAAALACGSEATRPDPETPTGTLRVSIATTGFEPDTDGYTLLLGGQVAAHLPANGDTLIGLLPVGDWTIRLGDRAGGCHAPDTSTDQVTVTEADTPAVALAVECGEFLAEPLFGVTPDRYRGDGTRIGRLIPFTIGSSLYATFTWSGEEVIYSGFDNADLSVGVGFLRYDPATRQLHRISVESMQVARPAISPDGTRMAYAECSIVGAYCATQQIRIRDLSTGVSTAPFARQGNLDDVPTWSPDGRTLYFQRNADFRSWIIAGDPATGAMRTVDEYCHFYSGIALSPDGTKLALACDHVLPSFTSWIRVVSLTSGSAMLLAEDRDRSNNNPSWSAGGGYIYFAQGNTDSSSVFRIGATGGEAVPLFPGRNAWMPIARP